MGRISAKLDGIGIVTVLSQDDVLDAQSVRAFEQADDGLDDPLDPRAGKRSLVTKAVDHVDGNNGRRSRIWDGRSQV